MSKDQPEQSRIERKKDKMRKEIISVALHLFRSQGFANTTMEQIAQEVDIAKKTLYNYFSEKEAIISSYVQESVKQSLLHLDELISSYPDFKSSMLALFRENASIYMKELEIWQVYTAYRMKNMLNLGNRARLRSGLEEILKTMIEYGQKTGEIRADLPARYLARQLEMSYALAIFPWLTDPQAFSLNDRLELCLDVFLNGANAVIIDTGQFCKTPEATHS